MVPLLTDPEWDTLIARIQSGQCTPFLGAGACDGILPKGTDIAGEWAAKYKYPMGDPQNLPRVAQYLATTGDPWCPSR